jgi:hypothetical protein
MKIKNLISAGCFSVATGLASVALADANIVLNNVDPAGKGFNDPTPAAPVGGNIGTTVGEQRLIAYQYALELWGARLESVPAIVVQGSFDGSFTPCDANGGVLAAAGALQIFSDFDNAGMAGTWYGAALANAQAGVDIWAELAGGALGFEAGQPDPGPLEFPFNDEIVAFFNGNIGSPNCLAGSAWYYGLDNNPPAGGIDFLNTFMHEVGHGLGFQNFADKETGELADGIPDIYTVYSFDNDAGKTHAEMNDEERVASFINTSSVVWIGNQVTAEAPNVLDNRQFLEVTAPAAIAGELEFGFANFGPSPEPGNFIGNVVLAVDGTGASSTDACEPLVDDSVAGNIALIDRGSCAFVTKALNAQTAGATGVMIANNVVDGGAIGLGGTSAEVVIPTIGISNADGAAIKAELDSEIVAAQVSVDPTQLAGADESNRLRLNAPDPVEPGSSISHYDPAAVPNLLMEPAITGTLKAATDVDLTDDLFADIGWAVNFSPNLPASTPGCLATEPTETVVVLGCDTGVPNAPVADVCLLSDVIVPRVDACAEDVGNHGDLSSCVAHSLNQIKSAGVLDDIAQGAIQSCAAQASIP